jgi:hypothetical protein
MSTDDEPLMAILARRARMTEGQLYTAVLVVVLVALLSLTGLPNAHRRSHDDNLSTSNVGLQHAPEPAP